MHRTQSCSRFLSMARAAFVAALCIGGIAPVMAYPGEELAKNAKLTLKQARQIAFKARAGQVTDQELEKEPGGSGLRYSFDIRRGRITYEVGIDAITGQVLENKAEGPHPD